MSGAVPAPSAVAGLREVTPEERFDGAPVHRILLVAFSCGPGFGSEPGAGWLWALAAAERHQVWLLTSEEHRDAIDAHLAAWPVPSLRVHYVPQLRRLPGGPLDLRALRLRYLVWQVVARRHARALHAELGFDLVHHITLSSDWMPAGAAGIDGVPTVWGPVGGYSRPSWSLARWFGPRWALSELVRRSCTGALRMMALRWTLPRVHTVIAQNDDVAARLARAGARHIVIEQNIALQAPSTSAPAPAGTGPAGTGRALFAGRLVSWKGVALALHALAQPPLLGWTLDVLGDGPERGRLQQLATRLGVGPRVRFHGMVDRADVLAVMATADALVLPSVNDSAGWVVAEAASVGCPVVCLDRGGPPLLARAGCGEVVDIGEGLPLRLAEAVARASRPSTPVRRWEVDRLPSTIEHWYRRSIDAQRTG
ncbi:MAG: glycosyltransferase [Acidimicrobiales bacterium]